MAGCAKMLGGMSPGRRVTAADVPADEAQAQIYPPATGFQAFFAAGCIGLYILNLIDVTAFCHTFHTFLPIRPCS